MKKMPGADTLTCARVALREMIKSQLKIRHSLPLTRRALIRRDVAALRELENLLPSIRRK